MLPRPVGAAAIALVVAGALLVVFRVARDGSLPGVHVAGVDVGALSEPQLRRRLRDVAAQLANAPITLRREGGGDDVVYHARGEETGIRVDVDATVAAVLARGRQGNPIAALADHLTAVVASTDVDVVADLDGERLEEHVEAAHAALLTGGREGDLRFRGTKVEPVYPEPGTGVARAALREAAMAAVMPGDSRSVDLPAVEVDPATDPADVDAVAAEARRALSAPVTLARGDVEVVIEPRQLAGLLDVEVADEDDPRLVLVVEPRRVKSELADAFAIVETAPVDASFSVSGGDVAVVPSQPGFEFDPARAARQLLALAGRDARRKGPLRGKVVQPDFTTKDARALRVTEQVSSFTTYHSCCEPRVANIHRAAELVDGRIVEPGKTFSLNDAIGPRTTESGFVAAPAISEGEFVQEVGGGISQLATTFFNAIFFGGYDFLEHQPHSYYISRYPPGREATISTPAPDLVFVNDSDSGIFIDTYYTDTSITVSFYGTQKVEVESVTGPRQNIEAPEEECKVNKTLGRGEEVVIQEGLDGFDIVVQRIFTYANGDEDVEGFSTHYAALPRIVERRDCRAENKQERRRRDGNDGARRG